MTGQSMLQDKYLKIADVCKTEWIDIEGSAERIFPLVDQLSFKNSRLIYWLCRLRGLPFPEGLSIKGLEKLNFVRLETVHNKEVVFGLIGQFWTPSGRLKRFNPDEFISYDDASYAKATWNFELIQINESVTRLSTETRVFCPTEKTKRRFKFYWTFVQPFSTLIRREILKSIKKQVETTN